MTNTPRTYQDPMEDGPRLTIVHLSQDDPKKCTARKMARRGLVKLVERHRDVHPGGILLDPFSQRALSPADREVATRSGIVALDCSWEQAEDEFAPLRKRGLHPRCLPFMLAVNPTNYGAAGKLTTLEAFAGTLWILGFQERARELTALYKWAPHFLDMNRQPLEEYAGCSDSTEVVRVQSEFTRR